MSSFLIDRHGRGRSRCNAAEIEQHARRQVLRLFDRCGKQRTVAGERHRETVRRSSRTSPSVARSQWRASQHDRLAGCLSPVRRFGAIVSSRRHRQLARCWRRCDRPRRGWCCASCARDAWRRDRDGRERARPATPSGATALSTPTALTGASMSATGLPSSALAFTLRRSTSTVSGSGWLVRYATGSLASIMHRADRAVETRRNGFQRWSFGTTQGCGTTGHHRQGQGHHDRRHQYQSRNATVHHLTSSPPRRNLRTSRCFSSDSGSLTS